MIGKDYTPINECLLCGGTIEMVLPLTPTPPANELLEEPQDQDTFPLNMVKCTKCSHLQIDASVNKERLYRHYLYCSDTSASNRAYFEKYANQMIERFHPKSVLDIASNDGLFLSYFKKDGIEVIGVDPAKNLAEKATTNGIYTVPQFFDKITATYIMVDNFCNNSKSNGKIPLITCNNAFAHNDDLRPILDGAKVLLTDDGTLVVEVQYAMAMLKNGTFDLLYHEHLHCHHLTPLISFFEDNGLRIYDAEEVATGWGSLRIYACKPEAKFKPTARINDLLQYEKEEFDKLLTPFASKIEDNKDKLMSILKDIKDTGKTISVLGHPARAMTLSYYFGLNKDIITDVFDDNSLKVGRYAPCTPKQILSTKDVYNKKPDYLLILSWNYAEAMMKTHDGAESLLFHYRRLL
jgi:SAM-dependent methyltransferase